MYSPLTQQLIEALRWLPGVGQKSAQRMAFMLLNKTNTDKALTIASTLEKAATQVKHCQRCRNYCETPLCTLCSNTKRQTNVLCIVETPADLYALEQTHSFGGQYFVLHGRLSPLEGIGPEEIGMDLLMQRIDQEPITELVLATNSTMEGEASAQYIAEMVKHKKLTISRIAHGVPLGGELEFLDGVTLGHAFSARIPMNNDK